MDVIGVVATVQENVGCRETHSRSETTNGRIRSGAATHASAMRRERGRKRGTKMKLSALFYALRWRTSEDFIKACHVLPRRPGVSAYAAGESAAIIAIILIFCLSLFM
jgi:hypothetical protein